MAINTAAQPEVEFPNVTRPITCAVCNRVRAKCFLYAYRGLCCRCPDEPPAPATVTPDEDRPASRYYMTESEWQQYLKDSSEELRREQDMIARMEAAEEAKHRNDPPTLADLKWLRPDLYW